MMEIEKPLNSKEDKNVEKLTKIIEEIRHFTSNWLGIAPRLINADFHQSTIAVTMIGVLAEAEKNASKSKNNSDLIAKYHVVVFKSVKRMLETRIAEISGKEIDNSSFMLDTESNCATILFTFKP